MKNAITVIDHELIEFFQSKVDDGCDNYDFEDLNELLQMAKDLIEINAELTKREQKQIFIIKSLMHTIERSHTSVAIQSRSSYKMAREHINSLKGGGDK